MIYIKKVGTLINASMWSFGGAVLVIFEVCFVSSCITAQKGVFREAGSPFPDPYIESPPWDGGGGGEQDQPCCCMATGLPEVHIFGNCLACSSVKSHTTRITELTLSLQKGPHEVCFPSLTMACILW